MCGMYPLPFPHPPTPTPSALPLPAQVRQVLLKEGVRGMYAGYGAFMLRDLPFDAIEFVTYEQLKRTYTLITHREPNSLEVSAMGAFAGGFTGGGQGTSHVGGGQVGGQGASEGVGGRGLLRGWGAGGFIGGGGQGASPVVGGAGVSLGWGCRGLHRW